MQQEGFPLEQNGAHTIPELDDELLELEEELDDPPEEELDEDELLDEELDELDDEPPEELPD